jgi:hypothetical protein
VLEAKGADPIMVEALRSMLRASAALRGNVKVLLAQNLALQKSLAGKQPGATPTPGSSERAAALFGDTPDAFDFNIHGE